MNSIRIWFSFSRWRYGAPAMCSVRSREGPVLSFEPQMEPQAVRRSHTVRVVLAVLIIVFLLLLSGSAMWLRGFLHEVSWEIDTSSPPLGQFIGSPAAPN